MRKNKPSPNNFPGADWQLLDELELSVGSSMGHEIDINVWLTEILSPLELQIDFFHRLLSSAQDAIARTMHIVPTTEPTYIQLLIFVPAERTSNKQIWGFFRIEKTGESSMAGDPYHHSIELYIYLADN